MNIPLYQVVIVLLLSIVGGMVYRLHGIPRPPWHEGPQWERFLKIYDKLADKQYKDCQSRLIPTTFGATHIYACGDSSNPPVFFLHGAASNALIYGDWLVPSVVKANLFTVSIDFVCDTGKSIPRDGDPKNCPQDEEEMVAWVKEIKEGLELTKPVSFVGYSYGCMISSLVAKHAPDVVDKLVLIAPAGVVAPVSGSFIFHAIVYGMFPNQLANWFFRYMSAEDDFDMKNWSADDMELTESIRDLRSTILTVQADPFEMKLLKDVTSQHPSLLIIGEEETVVNATVAVETAEKAGMQVKLYPRSGHLLLIEHPHEPVKEIVSSFLLKGKL